MATAARSVRRPLLVRFTPQVVILLLVAAAAAAATVVNAEGMWDMPGTTGYGFFAFVGMWTLMMSAMMLPSVAPFASMYARTVTERRFPRLAMFALGYLVIWSLMGIPAFGLASLADEFAGGDGATALAVAIFAACGVYQLTPLKYRCLAHCRTPMSHMLHYAAFKGRFRHLRAGFEHGYFCAACCWGLMALLVAFGVMNVPAMIVLAAVVATEKIWRWGKGFSLAVGAAALVAAIAVIWVPGLAPGLTNEPMDDGASGSMSMDGETTGGGSTMDDESMDSASDEGASSMDDEDMADDGVADDDMAE